MFGLDREVLEQKTREAQQLGEVKLRAEMKLGELTAAIPKASHDRGNQYTKVAESPRVTQPNKTFDFIEETPTPEKSQTKIDALKKVGIPKQRASQYEQLAAHPEIVEKAIAVRAAIRAIKNVKLAQDVLVQKTREAQDLGEAVIDAQVKFGELMGAVPKATKGTGGNRYQSAPAREILPGANFSKNDNTQESSKSQSDATLFTSGGEAKQEQKNTVRKPEFETPKPKS